MILTKDDFDIHGKKLNKNQLRILKSYCTLDEKFLLENYGILGITQVRELIKKSLQL